MKRDRTKTYFTVISLALCVLLALCLRRLARLEDQLTRYYNAAGNDLSRLEQRVMDISSEVYGAMEQEASILSDSTWDYMQTDVEDYEVAVRCTVSPKEYNVDTTEAFLVVNGTQMPMTPDNGTYTLELTIPVFETTRIHRVLFREGGQTRAEQLDWHITPRYDWVPFVYANWSHGWSGSLEDDGYTLDFDGEMDVNLDKAGGEVGIAAVTLVQMLDGQEVAREALPLGQEPWVKRDGSTTSVQSVPEGYGTDGLQSWFWFSLDFDAKVPLGSTYTLYAEVTDTSGLVHRCLLERLIVDGEGKVRQDMDAWYGVEGDIYDGKGNPLFMGGEELYQP